MVLQEALEDESVRPNRIYNHPTAIWHKSKWKKMQLLFLIDKWTHAW
jgi:hypothetical protein